MVKKTGCTFGFVLEQKVLDINENMRRGFKDMADNLKEIKNNQAILHNHTSNRIQPELAKRMSWLYGIIGTALGGLAVGLGMLIIKSFIGGQW